MRIRTCRRVLVIDPALAEYLAQRGLPEASKVLLVPDVGELRGHLSREAARSELELPDDRFVILVYGQLRRRKGLPELLRAVEEQADSAVTVLVAGRPDAETEQLLQGALGRRLADRGALVTALGFQTDEAEYRLFRAADAVWLGYTGGFYGSSGVLLQAASLGLPVLAAKEGLVGWMTRRHDIGLVIDPSSPSSIDSAIAKLEHEPALRSAMSRSAMRLAEQHTASRFGEMVADVIEELSTAGSN